MAKRKENPPSSDEIIENKWLVRFNREPFDTGTMVGFILDVNDDFTLLNAFDDDAGIIGFTVFRNETVKSYIVYSEPDWHESLVVKLKNLEPKERPNVSIDSIPDLLRTANENFPLVVVFREKMRNDACWIGKILEIKKKTFVMREISANAEWDEKPTRFNFNDVTRIEFGNGYENNLALVAEYRENEKPR